MERVLLGGVLLLQYVGAQCTAVICMWASHALVATAEAGKSACSAPARDHAGCVVMSDGAVVKSHTTALRAESWQHSLGVERAEQRAY